MKTLLLSRIQFFRLMALHILLPAFTVGLAAFIAVLEGLYLAIRNIVFLNTSKYGTRIFTLSFGMGARARAGLFTQSALRSSTVGREGAQK